MTPTLLCVDDDEAMTSMLRAVLSARGYHVICAATIEEAVHAFEDNAINLVILDLNLPDEAGFALFERLKGRIATAKIPVIMASGFATVEARNQASRRGAIAFLQKPYQMQQLLGVIQWAAPAPEPIAAT